MFLVSSCSCLCPIHWSQVLSWEWRCSWSSADRRCSNYIWVIDNFNAYRGTAYISDFTVYIHKSKVWRGINEFSMNPYPRAFIHLLGRYFVKSQGHEIGGFNYHVTVKFDSHQAPVKFQNDWTAPISPILPYLTSSKLREIWWYTSPREQCGVPVASIQKPFGSSGRDWKPWK